MSESSFRSPQTSAPGSMRSALAAVANLEQLLRSRNVAPKSIAQVLPDLEHCCSSLVADFEAMRQALPGARVASSPAAVRAFLTHQVNAFEAAIRTATRRTLNAAGRLRLENTVIEVSSDLAGLLPLVELWADAHGESQLLEMVELLSLSRTGDQPQTPRARMTTAVLAGSSIPLRILAPPRALLNAIGLVSSIVSRQSSQRPIVLHTSVADGENSLTIRSGTAPGRDVHLLLPPTVEVTLPTVVDVGAVLGLNIRPHPDVAVLSWRSPLP